MKIGKITFLILALVVFGLVRAALGQQPAPAKPTVAQPSAEQKARIMELAKAWQQKAQEAEAARDKYMIQLLSTLAELGLKPSETSIGFNEKGEPVFNRVEQAKTPTTPKPEAKP
jgi:hypothetical protein